MRVLEHGDAVAAAKVFRRSFSEAFPWIPTLHAPKDDAAFYEAVVFAENRVWGSFVDKKLVGFIAFHIGWIEQFYILPEHQGAGLGSQLLKKAKEGQVELQLWTFQRNARARRFYEKHGFVNVEETDGSRNEEKEPDLRYLWRA